MRIGVMLPQMGTASGPNAIRDVVQASEDMGFDSVWTADHVVLPSSYESEYPFNEPGEFPVPGARPFLELFSTLGFVAAVSDRIQVGVSVCVIPHRHPVLLAKSIATIDVLTQGRLIFGVGVGWLEEEFQALDAEFVRRGAYTDEALNFLRAAWSPDQPVSFHGEFVDVHDIYVSPQPLQEPVPIWVGGHARPALRRAARYGKAWHPHLWGMDPDRVATMLAEVNEHATTVERGELPATLFLPLELVDEVSDEDQQLPWETGIMRGDPEDVAGWLRRYGDAGVDHVLLTMAGSAGRKIEVMQRFMDEVHPVL